MLLPEKSVILHNYFFNFKHNLLTMLIVLKTYILTLLLAFLHD